MTVAASVATMAIMVYLAVAFLVAITPPYAASLSPGRLIGIGHSPHDGLRFIGVGYNLLDGNPQGVHGLGGFDPGFRDTYRVLQLTYDQEKRSQDRLHSVADQVAVSEQLSCSSSSERKAYTGAKGYQHDLSRSVDTRRFKIICRSGQILVYFELQVQRRVTRILK